MNITEFSKRMSNLKFKDYNLKWSKPLGKIRDFKIKYIILHHALASKCSIEDIHRWHLDKGWRGAGYNFHIRKDGTIEFGRPIGFVTAHTKGHNLDSIGICFEGNYDEEKMPTEQFNAGVELLKELTFYYNIPYDRIMPHRRFANKSCPGYKFPLSPMFNLVKKPTHWGEEYFNSLNEAGIKVTEKRFDEPMTRAEGMALIYRLYLKLKEG